MARTGIIVGTGFGVLTHLRAMRRAGIEVAALVGRDLERTRARASTAGIAGAYTNLDESLSLPGLDLVSVATPPHSHAQIVLRAIEAEKHVVCEKPFARDAREGQKMLDAAEAAGVVHALGTEFRWATGQAHAARAIRRGAIGRPRLATFMMNIPILADPSGEVPDWWSQAEQGGGWLGAFGSHVIDQLQYSLGRFVGVSASLQLISDRAWTVEDSYTIHFRTESGAEGVMQSCAGGWGAPIVSSRFYGETGSLAIEGNRVVLSNASGSQTLETPDDLENSAPEPPNAELMVTMYDHLHSSGTELAPYTKLFEAVLTRIDDPDAVLDPAPATFEDGVSGLEVLDAVRLSASQKRWVEIGEASG